MKEIKKIDAINEKLDVKYCVPDWVRDSQIELSCKRFPNRIQHFKELRTEPIALVCYGPSLRDTWTKVKDFKYIMSCSGSHKFLKDNGITPTWHVDVDPRHHKKHLIGNNISPDTEFLMASCCHPEVFDHLVNFNANIVLWHTFSGEDKSKLPCVYPRGEWVLTGGSDVGLRAMTIARFLGFTDIHVFGKDGSFPEDRTHAGGHPNSPKDYIIAEFNGKEYRTTTAYLSCARMTIHEIEMLPDVKFTFYGEGLVQDMVRSAVLKRKKKVGIAFHNPEVISSDYIAQNRELHDRSTSYGVSVMKHIDTIKSLYDKVEAKSLLDYGCGKGLLARQLDFPIWEYDPAIPGKNSPPRAADLVVCVDVLEHIEPYYLDNVLFDISRCIKKVGYLVIGTRPAQKTLPDGRNTHLIVEGKAWWVERLSKFFTLDDKGVFEKKGELHIIVSAKDTKSDKTKLIIEQPAREDYVHTATA